MIGSTIVRLDRVDSTNNYAATELLTKSLNEGTVWVTGCQRSGRGQGATVWESEDGKNLTLSIVLYPNTLKAIRQFSLSKAIALGVSDFLTEHIGDVKVKWPNDIYAGDRKIAGILIETAISGGNLSRAIVGIGLNVNQEIFISDAPNPVSMKNLTGLNYDLTRILSGLCKSLDQRYSQLMRENKGDSVLIEEYPTEKLTHNQWVPEYSGEIDSDYEKRLYLKNIGAKFQAETKTFEGRIIGVDSYGRLMIETSHEGIQCFLFKEVSFLSG